MLPSSRCREDWLLDVLPTSGRVVLGGFSWGGGAACRFAVAHPERVAALVLVSPDVQYAVAQKLECPTLLIWSKTDPMNPFLWTRRFRGHPRLTLHTTDTGGHRLYPSHVPVILKWLKEECDWEWREASSTRDGVLME